MSAPSLALPRTTKSSFLLGSLPDFLKDPLATAERAHAECGEAARYVLGPPGRRIEIFTVFDPDGVARVLNAATSHNFRKDGSFYQAFRDVIGNGLVTSQDEVWKRQRRLIQPLFTPRQIDGYAAAIAEETQRRIQQWRARGATEIDLQSEMASFTLSVVARLLFGEDASRMVPILRDNFPVLMRAARFQAIAPVHLPPSWPTPGRRKLARAERAIDALCDEIIAHRRTRSDYGEDLVGRLLAAREGGDTLTDDEVRDQLKVFLFAGHDTTSTALMFALRLLASNPDIQQKVRDEANARLGDGPCDAEAVHSLDYTRMALKETMRLYPSVPFISRNVVEDAELGGCLIPAGAQVSVSIWVIHHRKDLWPDPYRFDPDRFTPAAEAARHRFAWLPFGHGPRGCIGERFAMLEATAALAMFVRDFEFTAPRAEVPLGVEIVLHPKRELRCAIRPV